ncbi:MAG TPA: hypothetical protein VNU94_09495 [Acidobacteriaceae bacterium]|jgi:hypothetical protein|nr:hypothetical protein [Acidobacteriaceae bacterium]
MAIDFKRITYKELGSRHQEAYNFQKVSAVLADFGFATIRLTSDWEGADFIAQHLDGKTFLKIQLKGRLTFGKKYRDKDIYVCFRQDDDWYLYPHDEVLEQLLQRGLFSGTTSWEVAGGYDIPRIPNHLKELFEPYRITK